MPYQLHHLISTVYNQVCLDLKLVPAFHLGHLAVLRHKRKIFLPWVIGPGFFSYLGIISNEKYFQDISLGSP